ncbi:AMP-binding protein, partial [Massilia sp. Root335]|uniref:AMP-binding protein n=1 Tax=Massilia sp. Root335 TaxID=1736517 RepID=UPI0012F6C5F6
AYVPLDPAYPAARLSHMLADSAPALLVTDTKLLARLPVGPELPVLCLDARHDAVDADTNPDLAVHPERLCYVIYTSGSTGQPKGVAV